MTDSLHLTGYNLSLEWNTPIARLLETCCYEIDYRTKIVKAYFSSSYLFEGIQLRKASLGEYSLDEINTSYFDSVCFELETPAVDAQTQISLWSSPVVKVTTAGQFVILKYTGHNPRIPNFKALTGTPVGDLSIATNWKTDIRNLRPLLNYEQRTFAIHKPSLRVLNYGRLGLKENEFFGFKSPRWAMGFEYSGLGIIMLETNLGHDISVFESAHTQLMQRFNIEPEYISSGQSGRQLLQYKWNTHSFIIWLEMVITNNETKGYCKLTIVHQDNPDYMKILNY